MQRSFDEKFSISKLHHSHQRKLFSCNIKSLDDYIHKQVSQDNRKHISVTYVLNDEEVNKVAGYYTLSSSMIELQVPKTENESCIIFSPNVIERS